MSWKKITERINSQSCDDHGLVGGEPCRVCGGSGIVP